MGIGDQHVKHQVWIHETAFDGYDPALDHLGWAQPIGTDGKSINELDPPPGSPPVAGWRCFCECSWQGAQYYPRAEFPCADDTNPFGDPPPAVEGTSLTGAKGEWYRHVHRALPELIAHDLLKLGVPLTHQEVRMAVQLARTAGKSWSQIAAATGILRVEAETLWGSRRHPPAQRPWPHHGRRPDPPARGPQR